MTDIFLSYSSADREQVVPLVQALQEDGFVVWWDRDIRPGPSFDREIEQAIDSAGCMVVVWSSSSVESEWVRSEVEEGARRGILVPVMIEEVMPPLAYRRRQSADLSAWGGERDSNYEQLLAGIRATIAGTEAPAPERHGSAHSAPARSSQRRRSGVSLGVVVAALMFVGIAAGVAGWMLADRRADESAVVSGVARAEIRLPPSITMAEGVLETLSITADGKTITYVGQDSNARRSFFARRLDTFGSNPVNTVSSDVGSHWLSADGKWLVFNDVESKAYRKMPLAGGGATTITPVGENANGMRGLSWSRQGQIAFASDGPGISLVPATGGTPTALTTPEEGTTHRQPHFTRDGRGLLFSAQNSENTDTSMVNVIDLASGEIRELIVGDRPRLTASGHLLVVREGSLWAAGFDDKTLEVVGEPVAVLEGMAAGSPNFAVADNGTLVYAPALAESETAAELVWVTPEGQTEVLAIMLDSISVPRVSPDGQNILFTALSAPAVYAIWNHSLPKETTTKLTFDQSPVGSVTPSWAPDGDRFAFIYFGSNNESVIKLGSADGASASVALTQDMAPATISVASDGKSIVATHCEARGKCDLARVSTEAGDGAFEILLETPFNERSPEVSPDGRWIAYSSDQSGRFEVYVRPYADLKSRRWQISTRGGEVPMWSRDGKRLFFVQRGTNELMQVDVANDSSFNWSAPQSILNLETYDWNAGPNEVRSFDIDHDDQRFLLVRQSSGVERLVVIINWLEELKRLVPLG
jgi:Tol biopolymer transport system component